MNELPSRPSAKILRQADAAHWVEGYAFLDAAREEAQTLRTDTQRLVDEARSEGREQGRAEGLQEAAVLLAQTSVQVDDYLAGLESAVADLALDIVRQVLAPMDVTTVLLSCTCKALSAFRESQPLILYVAPAQLADVSAQLEPALAARLSVEGDASVTAGNARLSSAIASVELGLDTQLHIIRQALVPQADESAA